MGDRKSYREPGFARTFQRRCNAFGTRNAPTKRVTRAPPEEPRGSPIEPRPTVPIGTRKQTETSRVQTQVGLGVMPIEHAGEVPRRILPSNGVQGDPRRATAEIGRVLNARTVDRTVGLIRQSIASR